MRKFPWKFFQNWRTWIVLGLILHFAYDFFPSRIVAIFSGVNESYMQHAKIGVFCYLLTCIFEYLIWGVGKEVEILSFIDARVITLLYLPWTMFAIYYTAPAFYGKPMPTIPLEILYSNVMVLILGVVMMLLERDFEKISYSWTSSILLFVLLVLNIVEMAIFTFKAPWCDFFRSDEWDKEMEERKKAKALAAQNNGKIPKSPKEQPSNKNL